MKQLFFSAMLSLVTGIFFAAGLTLVFNIIDVENEVKDWTYVDQPENFEFLSHERIDGENNFTVKGRVKNTSTVEWENIQLFMKIYAGDAYMTYCSRGFDYIGPNSDRPFTIVCERIQGHNIPENVTYKLSVTRGRMK